MSDAKLHILREALQRIASKAEHAPAVYQEIARKALADAADKIEYHITARTWYGRNGGEFKAELRYVASGNIVFQISGTTCGSNAWAYAMRDAMTERMPDVFPAHNGQHATIYFRDVAHVEYDHREVSRKRDL
jgi:hypothetical protein